MSNINDKLALKTLCDDIFYSCYENVFEMILISESIFYELLKINKNTTYLNPEWVLEQFDVRLDLEREVFDQFTMGDILTNVWKFIEISADCENAKKSLEYAFSYSWYDHLFPKIIQSIQGHFDEKKYPRLVFNRENLLLKIKARHEKIINSCNECLYKLNES